MTRSARKQLFRFLASTLFNSELAIIVVIKFLFFLCKLCLPFGLSFVLLFNHIFMHVVFFLSYQFENDR